ncbi:hypothetical protein HQ865_25045 [Mucilaginibacter mali]|uniref:Uncharacterized protein n=1 Tax=Mucilaginibacter mali TaxID=2740462 RepID=A0A7D4UMG8_9SPHI|nr:hypothetical protein [Mucilaginibacter mali]QKJ32882.1 hypothetical protein HQ865_25045 [Mucilaginibacter mali]
MYSKRLFNKLKLSFSPLSNYDYSLLTSQTSLTDILAESHIYMIVQRPCLTFEELYIDPTIEEDPILRFKICKKGSAEFLECSFPYRRGMFKELFKEKMGMLFTPDYEFLHHKFSDPPYYHIANFLMFADENGYGSWFSPEKFLFERWNDLYESEVKGDVPAFLKYKVHYIGKATEEHVIKRLTGHEHLQDILSVEFPLHYGSLPTDEIAILFYEFSDNIHLAMFGADDEMGDVLIQQMIDGNLPMVPKKRIYLDAEKALINALKPRHNKLFYKSYPQSKDGLKQDALDAYTYTFFDPITLVYNEGEITGSEHFIEADMLLVKKGEPLAILKYEREHTQAGADEKKRTAKRAKPKK